MSEGNVERNPAARQLQTTMFKITLSALEVNPYLSKFQKTISDGEGPPDNLKRSTSCP